MIARGAVTLAGVYSALAGLVALLVAGALTGCETGTQIPSTAQQVHITTTGGEVKLNPSTVPAGDVYLVFESDPVTQHVDVVFVHRGAPSDTPSPLSDEDLALIAQDAAAAGLSYVSGFGTVHRVALAVGSYAFLLADPGGGQPGSPPLSLAVLVVTP